MHPSIKLMQKHSNTLQHRTDLQWYIQTSYSEMQKLFQTRQLRNPDAQKRIDSTTRNLENVNMRRKLDILKTRKLRNSNT